MSAADILQDLARWVQADTPDLYFDWVLMKRLCDLLWAAIADRLRKTQADWPGLSEDVTALDPAIDVLGNERWTAYAFDFVLRAIGQETEGLAEPFCRLRGESCLTRLATYHRLSAKMFTLPGLLNFRALIPNGLPKVMEDIEGETGKELRGEELRNVTMDLESQNVAQRRIKVRKRYYKEDYDTAAESDDEGNHGYVGEGDSDKGAEGADRLSMLKELMRGGGAEGGNPISMLNEFMLAGGAEGADLLSEIFNQVMLNRMKGR
jgi:hypothetical protein